MPRNVAPRGLPMARSRDVPALPMDGVVPELLSVMVVLSRKSCVIAMPMEAKERDVRSQARNVRSTRAVSQLGLLESG
jgi:hypothetical protein